MKGAKNENLTVYTTRSNIWGLEVRELYQSSNCPGFAQDFRNPVPHKLLRDYATPVGAAKIHKRIDPKRSVFLLFFANFSEKQGWKTVTLRGFHYWALFNEPAIPELISVEVFVPYG